MPRRPGERQPARARAMHARANPRCSVSRAHLHCPRPVAAIQTSAGGWGAETRRRRLVARAVLSPTLSAEQRFQRVASNGLGEIRGTRLTEQCDLLRQSVLVDSFSTLRVQTKLSCGRRSNRASLQPQRC